MVPLAVANVLHHKLRSALSALGVAIAVCMLITLSGLARGTLGEVADRWEAVDADLIVYPARWGENITTLSGGGLTEADAEFLRALSVSGRAAVARAVPVFVQRLAIAGGVHNVMGVDPDDLPALLGGGGIAPGGRVFDPRGAFARWLRAELSRPAEAPSDIPDEELAAHGGLEMVVDSRLARAGGLKVGDSVYAAGHHFTVVGVVPDGALARAFIPRATAEFLFAGQLGRYTLLFASVREHVRLGAVREAIARTRRLAAVGVNEYRGLLQDRFGIIYVYVDAVNVVTLIVAFLFILVTLYTIVLQRTREIAILRSMGAGGGYIAAEVLRESLLLTALGAAGGIGLSFAAAATIEALMPYLTVRITWSWVALAAAAAGVGGVVAALYPAWWAMRVDVVEALSLE